MRPLSAKHGITLVLCAFAASSPLLAEMAAFTRQANGVSVAAGTVDVQVQVITDSIVHVRATPHGAPAHPSIAVIPQTDAPSAWKAEAAASGVTLTTKSLSVAIDAATGAVHFADASTGRTILAESGREIVPATVLGEKTSHVRQQWAANADESLYGLGQQQLGIVDLAGYDLDLWQHNTNVVVPYLVSSKGYGILWNNTSYTRFGDLRPFTPIPAYTLLDAEGVPGGLTLTYPTSSPSTPVPPLRTADLNMTFHPDPSVAQARTMEWNGTILAPETGDYQLRANFNGGLKLWIDGKLVVDHWLQNWLTTDSQVKLHFAAGKRYAIRMLTDPEQQTRMALTWKTPAPTPATSLWGEVGDGIDYYFVYGPSLDRVVAGYRTLTGRANMMPSWIFGLWQSRQRYETAQQSLDVVNQFRERQIPFDNIVQDWQYWKPDAWGSHAFDPERFPDPTAWIEAIHARHAHLMLSVWGSSTPTRQMPGRCRRRASSTRRTWRSA